MDKQTLINKIQSCNNPYLLYQIRQLLQRTDDLQPLGQLVTDFPILIQESPPRDLRVITGIANESQIGGFICRFSFSNYDLKGISN